MSDRHRRLGLCHNRGSVSKLALPFTVFPSCVVGGTRDQRLPSLMGLPFISYLLDAVQCGRDGLATSPAPLIPGAIFGRILI